MDLILSLANLRLDWIEKCIFHETKNGYVNIMVCNLSPIIHKRFNLSLDFGCIIKNGSKDLTGNRRPTCFPIRPGFLGLISKVFGVVFDADFGVLVTHPGFLKPSTSPTLTILFCFLDSFSKLLFFFGKFSLSLSFGPISKTWNFVKWKAFRPAPKTDSRPQRSLHLASL